MKFKEFFVFFIVICGFCCQSEGQHCGKRPEKIISKGTIGSKKMEEYSWPWLVAFLRKPSDELFCAGNLILSKHVISAAYCFEASGLKSPQNITALVGKQNLSVANESGSTEHFIWQIILHPDWDSEDKRLDADIAVVVLRDPVEFKRNVVAICLPQSSYDEVLGVGTVVGWGKSERFEAIGEGFDTTPNEIKVPSVSLSNCVLVPYELIYVVSERSFCAGFKGKSKGPCNGDSGGGFYRRNPSTGFFELRGIASASLIDNNRGCDFEVFSFYTNVAKFVDWIEKEVEETKQTGVMKQVEWKKVDFDCEEDVTLVVCTLDYRGLITRNLKIRAGFSSGEKIEKAADVQILRLNFKSSTHIFAGIGETFPNLKRLRIDFQSIKLVYRNDLMSLEQLEVLDVSHNKIGSLFKNVFWDLPSLKILTFSDNQIEELSEKTFKNLKQITEINFSNNRIKYLPKDLFANNLELKRIFAYNNPLGTIDVDFIKLDELKSLWLDQGDCIDVWAWNREEIEETQKIISDKCNFIPKPFKG